MNKEIHMYMQRNQIIYIPFPTKENKSNAAQIKLVDILQKKYYVIKRVLVLAPLCSYLSSPTIYNIGSTSLLSCLSS